MRRLILVLIVLALTAVSAGAALASDLVHIVSPGETLYRISVYYGVSMSAIASANGIWNPNYIYAGQRLVIPMYSPPPAPPPYTPPPAPPSYPPYTPPVGVVAYHTVRPGDRLSNIAAFYGTTIQAIASANGISNPNYIFAGQVLAIPRTPVIYSYYVQYGDTLSKIARRYGTSLYAITSYNSIYNPNLIYPGMLLYVPV